MFKYYNSGVANKYSWFDIPESTVATIKSLEEPTDVTADSMQADERRFAQLVYVVNDVSNGIQEINQQLLENETLQQYLEEDTVSDTTWVAEALPGTAKSDTAWRVKKIDVDSSGVLTITNVTWAGGTSDFVHAINIPVLEDLF